jgi:Zn finger protein HypA/HybF involved in hydrogenase expression
LWRKKSCNVHEFAIVQSMVQELVSRLEGKGIERVSEVRFRCGSAFSEDALRQSFLAASSGTIAENATLIIDTVNTTFNCACGYTQVVTSDDLIGHMFVCPTCGAVTEVEEAHDVELVEVTVEMSDGNSLRAENALT